MTSTTFTISQTPDSANLYLYPNGSSSTELIAYPTAPNYTRVDDVWYSPNDDTDYVYSNLTASKYDYYGLPNHTTETGNINYVKVVGRTKSNNIHLSSSTFKLKIKDSFSGLVSSGSNHAPLTQSYDNYYDIFISSPSGASWDWNAIDRLNIGMEVSSNIGTVSTDFIMTPDGDGSHTGLNVVGSGTHWDAVVTQDDGKYVTNEPDALTRYDLYTYADRLSSVSGLINYVQPHSYQKDSGDWCHFYIDIYSNASNWTSTEYRQGETLVYKWYVWEKMYHNPCTGINWTWDDIDNIQAGPYLVSHEGVCGRVEKFYMDVNYCNTITEVRVTQCYAVVNYTPSSTTVTLNQPESLSVSHSRNIERFIFPSGDYEVIDTGRSGKSLQISGCETSAASTSMESLKDMCHYSKYVTVAGMDDTNLNTDYYITNFNYENVYNSNPPKYRWSISLEEA